MNTHLNIFKRYSSYNQSNNLKEEELENNLTRSLAITLQEDPLLFYAFLQEVISDEELKKILNNTEIEIDINIQTKASEISDFEKIIAVSLTDLEIQPDSSWSRTTNKIEEKLICDLIIKINDIIIVIEVKRDKTDCTEQLYKQISKILENDENLYAKFNNTDQELVISKHLNWRKLIELVDRTLLFQKVTGNINRFTQDFIDFACSHNPNWIPSKNINSCGQDKNLIERRLKLAVNSLKEDLRNDKNDRISLKLDKEWAQEILLNIDDEGNLDISIYPGNTKTQGAKLFKQNISFAKELKFNKIKNYCKEPYKVVISYHIKLTSFQKYFTGLVFTKKDLKTDISKFYTENNFRKFTGRIKKEKWIDIENLFNNYFKEEYKWKEKIYWKEKITQTKKTVFDLSFGYKLNIHIPLKTLEEYDKQDDMTQLIEFIKEMRNCIEEQIEELNS